MPDTVNIFDDAAPEFAERFIDKVQVRLRIERGEGPEVAMFNDVSCSIDRAVIERLASEAFAEVLPRVTERSYFIARGEVDQSEGRGGSRVIGKFAELEEALVAARGIGVQGDSGYVSHVVAHINPDGTLSESTTRITDRRITPEGFYHVGFLDYREFEFSIRLAADAPIRSQRSILDRQPLIPAGEYADAPVLTYTEVKELFSKDPENRVVLWRRKGDTDWRGEVARGSRFLS